MAGFYILSLYKEFILERHKVKSGEGDLEQSLYRPKPSSLQVHVKKTQLQW